MGVLSFIIRCRACPFSAHHVLIELRELELFALLSYSIVIVRSRSVLLSNYGASGCTAQERRGKWRHRQRAHIRPDILCCSSMLTHSCCSWLNLFGVGFISFLVSCSG